MRLILVELNEINFDLVEHYIENGTKLPGFKSLINSGIIETYSESKYENLEPWIQWPSVHTGKTYDEHGVFRLGDFVNSNEEQFFEKVEKAGYKVGAISPMNASNRLKNPAYFIPDPWTVTDTDGSFFSKIISNAISQTVNDNSQSKIKMSSAAYLMLSLIFLVRPRKYFSMISLAILSLTKPWKKALFLDKFLFEVHLKFFKKSNADFSTIFLNAGAHIQHHYFFNSSFVDTPILKNPSWYVKKKNDPILDMLIAYDELIEEIISIPDTETIISTGLSQKPYEEVKFYYRLKQHTDFLNTCGIKHEKVFPRMTRDFLIEFLSEKDAQIAEKKLELILVNNKNQLFGEIDNRGKELFVVLTYPNEITDECSLSIDGKNIYLKDNLTFVAIKNGEHQSKGFAFFSKGIKKFEPDANAHVSNIYFSIINFFKIDSNI